MIDANNYALDLSATEVDEIISDLKYLKSGGRICYLIDPADVTDYCFPFGLFPEAPDYFNIDSITIIGKTQFALEQLFNQTKDRQVLVTYNYQGELARFRSILEKKVDEFDEILRFMDTLDEGELSDVDVQVALSKYYPYISSCISGLDKKGFDAIEKLLGERKVQLESHLPYEDGVRQLLKRFRDEDYWRKYSNQIVRLFNLFPALQKGNKKATLSDCLAILTTRYLQDRAEDGVRFLYLSSQKKTRTVFKHELFNNVLNISNLEPSFLRTSGHLFYEMANRISDDYDANIIELQRSIDFNMFAVSGSTAIMGSSSHQINGKILELRSEWENMAMLAKADIKKFEHVQKLLIRKSIGENILSRVYNYLDQHRNSFHYIASKRQTLNLLSIHLFDKLINLLDADEKDLLWIGKDPVEGKNHILPINFPAAPEFHSLVTHLQSLVKVFIGERTWAEGKNDIKTLVKEGLRSDRQDNQFRLVLFTLLLFVRDPDDSPLLNELKDVLGESELPLSLGMSNSPSQSLMTEFKYVACWAARRAKHYSYSLSICDEVLKVQEDEPRFWHGRCLAIYSNWYERNKNKAITKEESAQEIQAALVAALNAQKFYQARQNEFTETAHTLEVLDNAISYLYLCRAKSHKTTTGVDVEKDLEASRHYLNNLKAKIKDWSRFPEYYHSEVELNIEEIRLLIEQKSYHSANAKRAIALNTINKTIDLIENKGREILLDECLQLKDELEKIVVPIS